MALSLVDGFDDLELDDLDDDVELVDLEHDELCIPSPFRNQLWTLCLYENTFSSISMNHNSSV